MEQQVASHNFSFSSPLIERATQSRSFVSTPESPSHNASLSLASWGLELNGNPGSIAPYHHVPIPGSTEWAQQVPSTTSITLDAATAPAVWAQAPNFVSDNVMPGMFEPDLPSCVSWDPSGVTIEHFTTNSSLGLDESMRYPFAPTDSDWAKSFSWTHWQDDKTTEVSDYQHRLTDEYGLAPESKSEVQQHIAPEEGLGRKKRGRPTIQTQGLDIDIPRYVPDPISRRYSTSDTSYTTSTPTSATTQTFDATSPFHLSPASDVNTTPTPPSFNDNDNNKDDDGFTEPPKPKRTRSQKGRSTKTTVATTTVPIANATTTTTTRKTATAANANTSTSTRPSLTTPAGTTNTKTGTTIPTTTPNKNNNTTTTITTTTKPSAQARNRAAASRYRAKTQAAFAQLEAAERDVTVRHQSLLACAARLRDEIFALKNELLRHADCECPLIRGYLSHAAEQAWVGLRAGGAVVGAVAALGVRGSGGGGGGGEGCGAV